MIGDKRDWAAVPDDVLLFGRILAAHYDWDVHDVFAYFEKPWKWTPERERWVALGLPESPKLGSLDAPEEPEDDE